MLSCPNCSAPMVPRALESSLGAPIDVGICAACSLLWFDRTSCTPLAPQSVLEILKIIGAGSERPELQASLKCPDCAGALVFTHDVQRTTHFTYWRCPADHSQLISFSQFLLEKNFVRPPSSEELAKLRSAVRVISCSQCGAAINLATDAACPYCRAPIALIDPDSVAKAVRELAAAGTGPPGQQASTIAGSTVHEAQMQAILSQDRIDKSDGRHDLLEIGLGAIAQLLHGL